MSLTDNAKRVVSVIVQKCPIDIKSFANVTEQLIAIIPHVVVAVDALEKEGAKKKDLAIQVLKEAVAAAPGDLEDKQKWSEYIDSYAPTAIDAMIMVSKNINVIQEGCINGLKKLLCC